MAKTNHKKYNTWRFALSVDNSLNSLPRNPQCIEISNRAWQRQTTKRTKHGDCTKIWTIH